MPPPTHRAPLVREWPWLAGVLLGWAFLLHPGFARFGFPDGADWDTYLASAAHLWLDPVAHHYNEWRLPLFPWLIGLFGALGSYVRAGQVLALVASLALVLGAGLLARALAGRWAGAVVALAAALTPLVVEGSWWVNPYPVVAGAGALALGLGAACARWPRWGWALASGAFGGIALAMDMRALPVACALPLLAALGPGSWRRRALLGLLALAPLLAFEGASHALRVGYDLRLRPFSSQLAIQHEDMPGVGAPPPPDGIVAASRCEKARGLRDPTPFGPCARLRRASNYELLHRQGLLPAFGVLLAGMLLCLLPPAWGRRGSLAAALVFWPTAASLALGTSLVLYPSRYLLPVAPLLAALGPVALARLAGLP
ncbi:MAG: glycosyltransferase family 39 protein, partial [Pseudomonadota bacterium]